MKLHTLDGSVLMDIRSVDVTTLKSGSTGLVIEGKIMGAMPMKAVIAPEQLRAALRLLNWRVVKAAIWMLRR